MARVVQACQGVLLGAVATGLLTIHAGLALAKGPGHSTAAAHHRGVAQSRTAGHARAGGQLSAAARHRPGHMAASSARPSTHARSTAAGRPAHAVNVALAHKHKPVERLTNSLRPLIVIDPGHGGRDPGAIGARGTQEKDITLAIALQLRRVLDSSHRYRTAMTRTRDETVSLADRLEFARRNDADLLIAIHADASPNRKARGASVYVSSSQGVSHLAASSHNSARIAQALTPAGPAPGATSAWLQYSLIDQLSDEVPMVVTPARSAHLYVLGARSIPSVLLETGFISNKQDEALLRKPAHGRRIVGAVEDAVDDYFRGLKQAASRT